MYQKLILQLIKKGEECMDIKEEIIEIIKDIEDIRILEQIKRMIINVTE
nr:MAG TPA: hypothetical protein [Caudoviricetes sp.]